MKIPQKTPSAVMMLRLRLREIVCQISFQRSVSKNPVIVWFLFFLPGVPGSLLLFSFRSVVVSRLGRVFKFLPQPLNPFIGRGLLSSFGVSAASLSCSRFFVALFVPFGCSFAAEPRVPILSFPESPPREGTLVVLLTPGWFLTGVAGVSLSFSRLVVPGRCVFFRFSLPVVAAPFIFCPGRCGFRVGYLLCRRASTVFSRAARREGM